MLVSLSVIFVIRGHVAAGKTNMPPSFRVGIMLMTAMGVNVHGVRNSYEYGIDQDYGIYRNPDRMLMFNPYDPCSQICNCEGTEARPQVDCSGRNLTHVPLNVSLHTIKL